MLYTHPDLSVAVTTSSVSFYILSCCVPSLSCFDATDSVIKDLETSYLAGKPPSQVVVAYDRSDFFQVQSVLFYGLSSIDVGVPQHYRPASVSQEDGNSIGQVWKR